MSLIYKPMNTEDIKFLVNSLKDFADDNDYIVSSLCRFYESDKTICMIIKEYMREINDQTNRSFVSYVKHLRKEQKKEKKRLEKEQKANLR